MPLPAQKIEQRGIFCFQPGAKVDAFAALQRVRIPGVAW
jgi:hypothetical protein